MKRIFVVMIGFLLVTFGNASALDAEKSLKERLQGSWQLLYAKYNGKEHLISSNDVTLRQMTDAGFIWLSYRKSTGVIFRSAGGSYTLRGDIYTETPVYGLSPDFTLVKGKEQAFTCRIEGGKWYHNGKLNNGLTIEEIWERVEAGK